MNDKFNPKVYKGKARVYAAIPKAPRISRMWIWDEDAKEYKSPLQGKIYYAARYETDFSGNKKRHYAFFDTLDECREWQSAKSVRQIVAVKSEPRSGPLFRDVMEEWRRRRFPLIAYSTQLQYDKVASLHFGSLRDLTVHEITPKRIDSWIFNEVAELSIAQQLLGNSDMKTTLVYAKRHAGALTKVVHGYWDRKAALLATACSEEENRKKEASLLATACNGPTENRK